MAKQLEIPQDHTTNSAGYAYPDPEEEALLQETMASLEQEQQDMAYAKNENPAQEQPAQTPDVIEGEKAVQTEPAPQYTNLFARICSSVANAFGRESGLGSVFANMADKLEAQFADPVVVSADSAKPDDVELATEPRSAQSEREASQKVSQDGTEAEDAGLKTNAQLTGMENSAVLSYANGQVQAEAAAVAKAGQKPAVSADGPQTVEESAKDDVASGAFERMADAKEGQFTDVHGQMALIGQELSTYNAGALSGVDVTTAQRNEAGESYVALLEQMALYGNTAKAEIASRYADDPETQAKAQKGLENLMRQAVGDGYNLAYEADQTYGLFSEEQRQRMDALAFPGVSADYSTFATAKDLQAGKDGLEKEQTLYREADTADVANNRREKTAEPAVEKKKEAQREASPAVERSSDRGKQAEERFADLLSKDTAPSYDRELNA